MSHVYNAEPENCPSRCSAGLPRKSRRAPPRTADRKHQLERLGKLRGRLAAENALRSALLRPIAERGDPLALRYPQYIDCAALSQRSQTGCVCGQQCKLTWRVSSSHATLTPTHSVADWHVGACSGTAHGEEALGDAISV